MEVKTININSLFLATKSPFFYKLVSNGKRDSELRHVTLQILASEEDALMDLLNFIYCNTLRSTTPTALLNVLMAADKFEVASCMRYCSQLLQNLPMSRESALLYLDLPSKLRMADTIQSLTDAAKKFLEALFRNMSWLQLLKLPLSGFEAFLMLDDLETNTEDTIYKLILIWAEKHYKKLKDRREILSTRLLRYVRFPYMSCSVLKDVLSRRDIEPSLSSEYVLNALFHKAESPNTTQRRVAEVERARKLRPMKVVELESPRQERICYLDIRREELAEVFPLHSLQSQRFDIGEQRFYLFGHCISEYQHFGLFLKTKDEKGFSKPLTIEYEFASRAKPSEEFVSRFRGKKTFTGGTFEGCRDLFGVSWTELMADDSPYLINGVLHLRAELTVKKA